MARILERELLDRISGPRDKLVIIGPGHSPEIDPTTLYLCTRVTHPQGQVTMVDSQMGSPLDFHEIPVTRHLTETLVKLKQVSGKEGLVETLMKLKLVSGGEGNALRHLEEIEAFKSQHPELFVHVPKIQPASGFDTHLPDNSATAVLNRGSLYWMLTKRPQEPQAVKEALVEMLRVLKPGCPAAILNEDGLLPDKDISPKIRHFLSQLKVPFEEYEVENEPYWITGKKFQPVYRYQKAFLFNKPAVFRASKRN